MPEKLTVLQSFPDPRPTTNPYLVLLGRSLSNLPATTVINFSWRRALLARYDVFHVHWPEILVDGRSPFKKTIRQALAVALVARLRITKTPIVRTVHNVEVPQGISRREVFLLRMIDRQTTMRIRLNDETRLPKQALHTTIPHGDYRSWFSAAPVAAVVPGQLAYVGLIRRYKGVDGLVRAFRGTEQLLDGLSLHLAGNPSTKELAASITDLARPDPRITLKLAFISDEELVGIVTSSELVVLPYRFMHNSGGTLMALSLGRPVLVPDNSVNRKLREEVGPGWVFTYEGDLTAEQLAHTVLEVRKSKSRTAPDFSRRNWDDAARAHAQAYRLALAALR
jgi:glycosyltransferase involved in cell wall biosynthesis